ncbi:uncharacterized protein LOC122503377 [Leptopilina heterotoma]|uniref:uncharacterized protein LOC122503377 n=1 Tax=Leptopilina heterotoma TaxID=63436 RepID=UPI001CA8E3D2|nr:uncharacterized protein LOC122503377 [Leptopilina heterotoma]
MDGKEIRIKKPPFSGSMFFNYKKFYSFKLLATCDAHYRFTWIDVGDYGSVSDVSALKHTDFFVALENNELDLPPAALIPGTNIALPYAFIGDAIFPLKKYLMKPFDRNRQLNERQKAFNYRLARARNTIEDSFGLLSNKWLVLKDSIDFKLTNAITIVQAVVCLHNFLLTEELLLDERDRRYEEHQVRQVGENNLNEENDFDIPQEAIEQRNVLADYFISEEAKWSQEGTIFFVVVSCLETTAADDIIVSSSCFLDPEVIFERFDDGNDEDVICLLREDDNVDTVVGGIEVDEDHCLSKGIAEKVVEFKIAGVGGDILVIGFEGNIFVESIGVVQGVVTEFVNDVFKVLTNEEASETVFKLEIREAEDDTEGIDEVDVAKSEGN